MRFTTITTTTTTTTTTYQFKDIKGEQMKSIFYEEK
jgi:hypothetical protein